MTVADIPVQSLISSIKLKALQNSVDPISFHTLNIWFDLIKQVRHANEINELVCLQKQFQTKFE